MKRLRRLRRWFTRRFGYARLVCVVLLVGFAVLRFQDPPPVEELRIRTFDIYQHLDPRTKKMRPVTIVDIDEKSLADPRLGQWPWPRTRVADIVNTLARMKAAVIGFDVVFSEPDRLNPDNAAENFRGLDEATREKLRALPSNDQIFADAIKKSRVVLGESAGHDVRSELDKELPVTGFAMGGEDPDPWLFEFRGLLRNVRLLELAAAGRGLFTIVPERDGLVRRVPMIMLAQGVKMPSLSFEILRVLSGSGTIIMRTGKEGIDNLVLQGLKLKMPTDKEARFWVHYADNDPSIYVSAVDVLDGRVPPDMIDRKIVLIGTSAAGMNDIKTTPVSKAIPGVEIHAQILETVVEGLQTGVRSLSRPGQSEPFEFLAALVAGLLVIAFAPNLGPATLFGVGALFATALVGTSWYFYIHDRMLIDFTYPLLSTTAIYLTLIFSSFVTEQRQRKLIRGQFAQYMSPVLVEQLAQAPEKLVLGGEEREMTIMFTDVRGFTTISESFKHDPQGLTRLMNRFLTPLTNVILARKGYIDKYMGDAIMAFWNAPLDDSEHEINACNAAIDMLEKMEEVNKEREEEAREDGHPFFPLKVGVGLNTGAGVVGNMGSDLKFNYSVLGDSVNLASRLEGQTKEYGFPIIVGSKTAMAVKEKFAILELDFIMVKGKTEPEVIYAIAGRDDVAQSEDFQRLRNLTIEMLSCYRSRDWDGALDAITRGRNSDHAEALDHLHELYEERIKAYKVTPPPADWNGAYQLLTK